ncbi:coenzyme A transporter [Paramarasmius palmivorus]|uniref:Coenzyme A transporter n=1 Tax=Paramarasmius palmivorus TaxID=297713 RepID=A0AAW0E8A9_9AGAR
MPTPADRTPFRRMVAGSVAGISVLPFTYPFELARVRMAILNQRDLGQNHLVTLLRTIYNERVALAPGGLSNFYRGFAVTLAGTIPYRGGIFLAWESLNESSRHLLSSSLRERHRHPINLVIGALAGATAQIVTYPIEVVRRMQQASGHNSIQPLGVGQTVKQIWRTSGWRGFYFGLGVGLLKQVPMHSVSLATWQAAKRFLGI